MEQEKNTFWGLKGENKLLEPKNGIRESIGIFIWSKKEYTFWGQKG
jgi:hypothetical protein